ncbi:MAG: DUF429 domain-containing protein [Thaumarchaeota archaeon]|nr:DUF429 domain-containing protein [Nitrososphaerota archaeon]
MISTIGVDLAGSPRNWTGLCYLDETLRCEALRVHKDEEIIRFIEKKSPDLVAVDAPLTLPRKNLAQPMRECDRALMRMGLRPLPLTLRSMKLLTLRGIKLREKLESSGFRVIEVFPTGAQKILGISTKRDGVKRLREDLQRLGLKNLPKEIDGDILDAATCAFIGILYLKGLCIEVGDPDEGMIVIPRKFK